MCGRGHNGGPSRKVIIAGAFDPILIQFRSRVEWVNVAGSGTIERTVDANVVIVVTNRSVVKSRTSK